MDKLSWGDLFVIKRLTIAVQDRSVAAALFAQADADRKDTSTEYGGALVFAGPGDGLVAKLYKPRTCGSTTANTSRRSG